MSTSTGWVVSLIILLVLGGGAYVAYTSYQAHDTDAMMHDDAMASSSDSMHTDAMATTSDAMMHTDTMASSSDSMTKGTGDAMMQH